MASKGELLGERYRLGDCIGKGALGEVYAAVQEPLGRPVAIKVLRGDIPVCDYSWAAERFHHEAHVTANLRHPNIVTLYDYGRTLEGRLYMAMELVPGTTLEQVFQDAPLGIQRTITLFAGLLEGLEAAHRAGLVHRDLKPANVIVSCTSWTLESVKILDFGMAVFGSRGGKLPQQWIAGSPGYMSPEQALFRPVDARSDIYAVGVMLFEALMGRRPFNAMSIPQWLEAHRNHPVPRMDGIPDELQRVVRRAMAKNPNERFSSVREMRRALLETNQPSVVSHERVERLKRLLATVMVSYTTLLFMIFLLR